MLSLIKNILSDKKCNGLTIIEAMVATAILGIGFAGVFSLTAYSELASQKSIMRMNLQLQANQILEIIESDVSNIDNYDNMDLTTCTDPGSATDTYLVRGYEWCQRIEAEVGAAQTNDTRSIDITTLADGQKVVHLILEGRNGNVQIVMKRSFDN